jgi:hypothetical protein
MRFFEWYRLPDIEKRCRSFNNSIAEKVCYYVRRVSGCRAADSLLSAAEHRACRTTDGTWDAGCDDEEQECNANAEPAETRC